MISDEKVIETKVCKHCSISFDITDKDLEFYDKISPVFNGIKYSIPTPTLCPDCRLQRRLSWRNDRNLYKRKSDLSSQDIISIFSPDKVFKVYSQPEYWGDSWSAFDFGKEFDFSKTLTEQLDEINKQIPQLTLFNDYIGSVNSDYINFSGSAKNCYLLVENGNCEDCNYSFNIYSSKDCIDNSHIFNSQKCYECVDVSNCFNLKFSNNCTDCKDSYFLNNCTNCSNCFLCNNLSGKEFYILNKQYSKEEYSKEISGYDFGNKIVITKLKKIFSDNLLKFPVKYYFWSNNENSSGNYLSFSKNSKNCFDSSGLEDCKYLNVFQGSKYSYDCFSWGKDEGYSGADYCYESIGVGNSAYKIFFCFGCWENVSDIYYSYLCRWSKNLFGCIGLRNAQYCILNKQYTKEEYESLVPRIIEHMKKTGEWGEFFPSSISPFGYNETVANEYFPITRTDAINRVCTDGKPLFKWSDYKSPKPDVSKTIPADKLPNNIKDIPDDILNWAIVCEITKKPFRIIKPELEFYRKHNLPIPRRHPDRRHLDRMKLRNPRKLYDGKCDKCGVEMKTTYSPDRSEIVYCVGCYEKEVY